MAELTFLNEASVVHNLATRYSADSIYTYSGLFLVAVNPYKELPIYGSDTIEVYKNQHRDDVSPHIFSITDQAFRNMLETYESQSILVTGESGAGKTENTKKVIQYLAAIACESNKHSSQRNRNNTKGTTFEQQILQANPILEAFGNAQTIRNNNSSRFGKFIRIEFNKVGQIAGASIDWYLLEKSRVIRQNSKERNYHIFYQLVRGAPKELRDALILEPDIVSYAYLKNANKSIDGVDDKEEFKNLLSSFKIMGLSSQEVNDIFRIISAILHIGNIQLGSESTDQGRVLNIPQLERVAHLLGIQSDQFMKGLLKPRVQAGREWVTQSRSADQVRSSLDALAKSLYERVFSTIVSRINQTLERSTDNTSFIGVLDIAGFEIFQTNSFEQLCINYTNEKLQQFFNHHMFVLEQEEYTRENIEWKFIDFGHDLQPTIDLIEKPNPMGIFSCLDEDCVMPRATDNSFTEKVNQLWANKSNKFKPTRLNQGFILTHYAAEVEYSTDGWLEKNKDPLNENVVRLLVESSETLVRHLFAEEAGTVRQDDPGQSQSKNRVKKGIFRTVAQRHKEHLAYLMAQLHSTHPHFVRCIVPNGDKSPKHFNNHLVLDQLRCNGVLEGIRIARTGYPNRLFFSEFRQRYEVLVRGIPKGYVEGQKACVLILKDLRLDENLYKVGLTKVFFKSGVLAELEERREALVRDIITRFQSTARGHLQRVQVRKELFKSHATQVIKRNLLIYLQLKDDPWWKLYVKTRPLLIASRDSGQARARDAAIKKLESTVRAFEEEKTLLEEKQLKADQELKSLNKQLDGERLLALDKEEILKRSQEREASLEEQLNSTLDDLDKLEIQIEELFEAKKKADSQADLWRKELENGASLIGMLEKEKLDLKTKLAQLEEELNKVTSQQVTNSSATEKIEHDLNFLRVCYSEKEKKVDELEKLLKESDVRFENRLKNAEMDHDSATNKVLELAKENNDIRAQLNELINSSADYEALIRKKESEVAALKSDLSKIQIQFKDMDKEKGDLLAKYNALNSELDSVKREINQLRKTNGEMDKEASELRRLLDERISEDIKMDQGRKVIDKHIEELRLQVATQQEALNAERERFKGETAAKQSHIDRLQREKEGLLEKAKNLATSEEEKVSLMKELEIEKAKAMEVNKLRIEIGSLTTKLKSADKVKEETSASLKSLKSQLSESQDNGKRLEKRISEAQTDKDLLTSELTRLNDISKEYMNQRESWNLEKSRSAKEVDNLRKDISAALLEKEKLQAEISNKTSQIEKLRSSITAEVESQVSKTVQERDRLAASERKVKTDLEDLSLKHATLQVHKEKMERDIEDLHHDLAREKKATLSAERIRNSLQEQLVALKDSSETERRSRSEVEVLKRKLTVSLDSTKRQLQERTDQLLVLQKVINPRVSRNGSVSWEEASKYMPDFVDLAKRLEDSEKARKKAEESKALLKAQLEDAKQRWSKALDDKDSEYYATRRALLEDLASIATNPSTPPTPARSSTNKRPLSSNLSSGNFHIPTFDLKPESERTSEGKENTNSYASQELDISIKGKTQFEIENLLRTLQSSKSDLLGVYHDTSKNLVKTKEQLSEVLRSKSKLEREIVALKSNRSSPGDSDSNGSHEAAEITIRLDAEISRNQDLQESIRLYKSRSEEYYNRLETAEAIVIKASRAEQFAKGQCKEAEEALASAKKDLKQSEKVIIDLHGKVDSLEGELEDKNIDLNHAKEIQQRLSKEIDEFNNRWSSEMSVSHSSIEAMRKRYSEEIRTLSEELESQKQLQAEFHNVRRQLERQIDELRNKDTWQVEKESLESKIYDLSKSNEEATFAYQDSQKRIGSLLSQVRTLRSTMGDITVDRDQLQKDKRILEKRLTEVSRDFEDLASFNLERGGTIRGGSMDSNDPEVLELRRTLKKRSEESSIILERLRESKRQLEDERAAIEKERGLNEDLQKQIAIYDKQKKQLHLQLLEMESRSLGVHSVDDSKFLRQKVNELENQLQEQGLKYAEELRSSKSNDRSVRDLYNQINQKDKVLQRLQNENTMNEEKMKKLNEALEVLESEETTHRLAVRRAEREARDAKESALRLEKELEDWKSRFESLTSNRLSRSEYEGRSFV